MIFTDYSQHIPKITASPVCTAIKETPIASNYAFHFHRALKFRLCIFLNAPSPDPLPGLRPWTRGLPSPDPLVCPQLHLLDPPLLSVIRIRFMWYYGFTDLDSDPELFQRTLPLRC